MFGCIYSDKPFIDAHSFKANLCKTKSLVFKPVIGWITCVCIAYFLNHLNKCF